MKTYFFTCNCKEYRIKARTIKTAVIQLSEQLVKENELFKVDPYYYCLSAERIPTDLYKKYLEGYSF